MSFLQQPQNTLHRRPDRPATGELLQFPNTPQITRDQDFSAIESRLFGTPRLPSDTQFTPELDFFTTSRSSGNQHYQFRGPFDYVGDQDVELDLTQPIPVLGQIPTSENAPIDPRLSLPDYQISASPNTTSQSLVLPTSDSLLPSTPQVTNQDQPQSTIVVGSSSQSAPTRETIIASESLLNSPSVAAAKRGRKRKANQVADTSNPGPASKKRPNPKAGAKSKGKGKSKEKPKETSEETPESDLSNITLPESYNKIHQARKDRHLRWRDALVEQVERNEALAQITLNEYQKAHPIDLTDENPAEESTTMQTEHQPQGVTPPNQPTTQPHNPAIQTQNPAVPLQDPFAQASSYLADPNTRRKLKVGGVTLQRAGLGLPYSLPQEEIHHRLSSIDAELQLQKSKAPILPPSELTQPGPKPFTPKAYHVPDEIEDPRVRNFFDRKNHDLCTRNKQIDLERNNQAAKGTRHRREEALNKYRDLANGLAVELNWWRLKAISLGADHREWDNVPATVKEIMSAEMSERVRKLEESAAREAKKHRSSVHSARTSENARLSKDDEARKKQEILEVAAAYAAEDYAEIERLADPNYRATVPGSPSTTADLTTTASDQNTRSKRKASVGDQSKPNAAAKKAMTSATEGMAETTNTTAVTSTMGADSMPNFGNSAQVNTDLIPAHFNVTTPPMYSGAVAENAPFGDFLLNQNTILDTQNNTRGNIPAQDYQSQDLLQEGNDDQQLRTSNVAMLDAQPDTIQAPPQLDSNMQGMMNEPPYWEVTDDLNSSAFLPDMNQNFQGSLGDVSSLPPNNMSHNIHGPLRIASPLLSSNINQNAGNVVDMSWYNGAETLGSRSLADTFLLKDQDKGNQAESLTNGLGSSNQLDTNVNSSAYPDPIDESFYSRYLHNLESP
ncbi:hypothetical protein FLONG3_2223 [Fusarium longipes]|uniref:BZIP domain-containing protein n=1 Tax=Fusarium longipes TaxID=694270 RepID=A0A395T5J7_9HYPO|nr:hypothetical protein FLONG3_2223 [Fusarium longipes]